MENKSWSTRVESDPEDPEALVISFPDEILDELGWKVGDTLIWDIQADGSVILSKK